MRNLSIGIFESILGIVFILIGLEIYWPFKESMKEKMRKMKPFYIISGIGILLWGLVNLLLL